MQGPPPTELMTCTKVTMILGLKSTLQAYDNARLRSELSGGTMPPALRVLWTLAAGAGVVAGVGSAAHAQTLRFKARLTPVPVETSTAARITGSGSVTATLTGTRLALSGTFAGMKSAATIAQVHFGVKGVRGPVEFDLTVENAPSGAISGGAALTKVQLDSLRKGWFYIQIHAEKAPDGNLWGWLLPE